MITHEAFIASVADIALARLDDESRELFTGMKLAYGMGANGAYGVTYFKRWKAGDKPTAFVEIGARHQLGWAQVATTVIHELAHVLAGWEAGHDKGWKAACERLGLRRPKAVGQHFLCQLEPAMRFAIAGLEKPGDGQPICDLVRAGPRGGLPKPCTGGKGTKGGKSFGPGSGSRLLKFACDGIGHKPTIVRASAGAAFDATCNHCQTMFRLTD